MTKRVKVLAFLQKTGKSYTAKSLSKILNLNYETTRKYLRWAMYDGQLDRIKKSGQLRYSIK
jgi:response regulator of citrate/malate metabolism